MKVCYFGTFDPSFTRNAVLIKGLRQNGAEVVLCNSRAWSSTDEKLAAVQSVFRSCFHLSLCYVKLLARYLFTSSHDVILVGYAGHIDVFVAKVLAILTRRPLVLDAFLSLYETAVEDRQIVSPRSLRARLMYIVDRCSANVCDLALLDTNSHIEYYVDEFRLPREKFRRALATADDDEYRPTAGKRSSDEFRIIYFGQFIPLHGVEHIIDAAAILKERDDIRFVLCGTGQTLEQAKDRALALGLDNLEFMQVWVGPGELDALIEECDLCLGVFGDSGKALRVIPNKVFVGLAKAKAVLSGDSPAMREIFVSGENIFLCKPGSPSAIAESILTIVGNEDLRRRVGNNGYSLYRDSLSPRAVGARLVDDLRTLCTS